MAEDAVARLDNRSYACSIREGWIARAHFAAASPWREGALVHWKVWIWF